MQETKPVFNDVITLINELQSYPAFDSSNTEPTTRLADWLAQYSRVIDTSKGFLVNRCALYWTGYNAQDGFDGQAFVDSCQDSNGSLRQLAQILDTDLQIFELDPHSQPEARSSNELAMAASYGMMGIEESTQLFCACSFGQGVESISEFAMKALDSALDLETYMTTYCGLDHAAMMGASIASILKGIPVILEGSSGALVKAILEKFTSKTFDNIILTNDMTFPINHDLPGQKMIMTAIILKTLYAAQLKTDCGKVKTAAA